MSYLNNEEIEKLKLTHPKKRTLRFIFLLTGLFIMFLGFLFFFTGFDFEITLEGINLSLFVDILIIVFGGIITSKFFITPYYIRENSLTIKRMRDLREPIDKFVKFNSITLTRGIAALLLISVGIFSFLIFGDDIGHEVKYGSAVFLGGPSWFYVTGLPMLGIGLGLIIYFLLSPFRGVFSKSKNFLFFYEIRPGFPWLTEIPRKDIEVLRYQNNHAGPKLAWIIIMIPFIVLQLMTAIPLFAAERAGPEFVLSWTFVIISFLDILALIILVMFQQNYFEITTKERLYEMWFSPVKLRNQSQFKEDFSTYLDCNPNLREGEELKKSELFSDVSTTNFQLFNLVFGLFLIVFAIVMLTQMVFFGPLVWWISLMYGLMLFVKSLFYDFGNKDGDILQFDEELKKFRFKRSFYYKFNYVATNNIESINVRKWYRKLDFFDIFGISGLLVFMTIQQVEGWVIADTMGLIIDNLLSTSLLCVVIVFIIFYLCLPIDVVEFKTTSITYRIPITLDLKEDRLINKYLKNLKVFPKEVLKPDMRKTFFMRLGAIGAFIIGALIYIAIYFAFSF